MGNPAMLGEIPPDPRLSEGTFNPEFGAPRKPEVQANPLINTPTQPAKFLEQPPVGSGSTLQQPKMKGLQRKPLLQVSAKPFQSLGARAPPESPEEGMPTIPLNLRSKDFIPKVQQMQDYCHDGTRPKLPGDFMDKFTTILNLTGTDQISANAKRLEQDLKDEYIPKIAEFVVLKRAMESDEKRVEFLSKFF